MRAHLTTWLWRYLPAEIGGTLSALLCAWLVALRTGNPALSALSGAWGETLAYYATMLTRALATRESHTIPLALRALALEFGPAEVLDSLVLRPLLLYQGLRWAPSPLLGILGGKIAADLIFYAPVIASYELQRTDKHPATEDQSR